MKIECCHGCVPPKRHTACWGHCPEYAKAREEYEARKVAYYGDSVVNQGLIEQRTRGVMKMNRHNRKWRKR